jgi:hypothetical protein
MRVAPLLVSLSLVAACGGDGDDDVEDRGDDGGGDATDDGGEDDGGEDDGGAGPAALEHDFPTVPLEPGEEVTSLCLSWKLNNDEPVFFNSVTMNAGPGWHHSNWFYVPSGLYSVEDGVWDCRGEFDQLDAAVAGGVLFAQSTQATDETQAFPPGAVVEIPPDSVVVSQIHLLNVGDEAIETGVKMTIAGIAEDEIEIKLNPLSFTFDQLAIPPQQRSRFEVDCDMEEAYGGPLEMSLYYVLPHYHSFAEGMDVLLSGGERDGETVHRIEARIGEPLGTMLSPPLSMSGSTGIRFACNYDNGTDRTIGYGNSGEDEMCIFLAFTDSNLAWGGGVLSGEPTFVEDRDGVAVYTGGCTILPVPR